MFNEMDIDRSLHAPITMARNGLLLSRSCCVVVLCETVFRKCKWSSFYVQIAWFLKFEEQNNVQMKLV